MVYELQEPSKASLPQHAALEHPAAAWWPAHSISMSEELNHSVRWLSYSQNQEYVSRVKSLGRWRQPSWRRPTSLSRNKYAQVLSSYYSNRAAMNALAGINEGHKPIRLTCKDN